MQYIIPDKSGGGKYSGGPYKWCICPEGNGVDTYRLWEAMYLGCIPIVLKSPFIDTLMHYTGGELPIYVVETWDKLCLSQSLTQYRFDSKWLKFSHWVFQITTASNPQN